MKMDSEANSVIFDLCVSSEKARTIAEDIRDMIDEITVSNLKNSKEHINTYVTIAFDYIFEIDKSLNNLAEKSELIKEVNKK